jgi:hypothetical protein
MKRQFQIALIAFFVLTAAIQLIRPERFSAEEVSSDDISRFVDISGEVKTLLDGACNDCHSDNTVWPWYSNIAPISWLIAYDVEKGKERLNFSAWSDYSDMQKLSKFFLIDDLAASGEMPLLPYKIMHKAARLTEEQRKVISDWAKKEIDRMENE